MTTSTLWGPFRTMVQRPDLQHQNCRVGRLSNQIFKAGRRVADHTILRIGDRVATRTATFDLRLCAITPKLLRRSTVLGCTLLEGGPLSGHFRCVGGLFADCVEEVGCPGAGAHLLAPGERAPCCIPEVVVTGPVSPLLRSDHDLFRILVLRRLCLPLPLSSRSCPPLNLLGHHQAKCSRAGLLGRRGGVCML